METRPIGATLGLSAVAFVLAGLVGISIFLYFFAAWNGASAAGLLVGGIVLFAFGLVTLSAIDRLRVAGVWAWLGVAAGFLALPVWLALFYSPSQ
jgi:hypothetical protein